MSLAYESLTQTSLFWGKGCEGGSKYLRLANFGDITTYLSLCPSLTEIHASPSYVCSLADILWLLSCNNATKYSGSLRELWRTLFLTSSIFFKSSTRLNLFRALFSQNTCKEVFSVIMGMVSAPWSWHHAQETWTNAETVHLPLRMG
jgi:hypothetical protein